MRKDAKIKKLQTGRSAYIVKFLIQCKFFCFRLFRVFRGINFCFRVKKLLSRRLALPQIGGCAGLVFDRRS